MLATQQPGKSIAQIKGAMAITILIIFVVLFGIVGSSPKEHRF
jgi:hypothetical protein